ncbi:MAG: hypothetical protein VKI42_00215 [Synechococcaceae cyanobacterium]|nr:hypothetical protein [Synechococcaceae cyanobacterium]
MKSTTYWRNVLQRLEARPLEADAIISTWFTCSRFASVRVDRLTVRTDRLLDREVLL